MGNARAVGGQGWAVRALKKSARETPVRFAAGKLRRKGLLPYQIDGQVVSGEAEGAGMAESGRKWKTGDFRPASEPIWGCRARGGSSQAKLNRPRIGHPSAISAKMDTRVSLGTAPG